MTGLNQKGYGVHVRRRSGRVHHHGVARGEERTGVLTGVYDDWFVNGYHDSAVQCRAQDPNKVTEERAWQRELDGLVNGYHNRRCHDVLLSNVEGEERVIMS